MYSTVSTTGFPGLDLTSAADDSGCVDLLNVDFSRHGAVRVRDGYDNFTGSAGASAYTNLAPYYDSSGTTRLVAMRTSTLEAFNTSGTSVATQGSLTATSFASFVRFGAPATELLYCVAGGNATGGLQKASAALMPTDNRLAVNLAAFIYKYNGTTFTSVTSPGVQAYRVWFSDAGLDTFGANNYVELSPGDGERIQALATWRESVFAFKETKFYVFYGNSTDSAGNPVFNYRPIASGAGCLNPRAVVAAPEGLYFCSRDGVYVTTGGPPVRISDAIEPLFTGKVSSFFASSAINQAQSDLVALGYVDGRLYMAYPSGSATANDRTLVYDTRTQTWALWTVPAAAFATLRIADRDELMFTYASGSNHVGRHNSTFSTDDGTAIVSRYRTGFANLGDDDPKSIGRVELWGTGTVNYQLSKDFGALDTASSVAMGTSPAIARGRAVVRGGVPKTLYSWQVGASSGQWTLHRIAHHVQAYKSAVSQAA